MGGRRRGPAGISEEVELGTAELLRDSDRPSGWTLLVDGTPQSYVDLDDPTWLEFEYVRRIAAVLDAAAPPGQPLRVLHLGGGALTLPRYVAATRAGSVQRVVERDTKLISLIRRALPLPRNSGIRIRSTDARAAVEASAAGRFDVVITDVYQGARMPGPLTTVEFAAQVARILRPGGLHAVNVADGPPLRFARTQVATMRAVFADVCVLAEPGVLRNRRFANVVLVGVTAPGRLPLNHLATAAARDFFPGRLVHGAALDRFAGGACPVTDRNAPGSPEPPSTLFS